MLIKKAGEYMENRNILIGKRIKQRREELGLTQEDLGNRLWLNKSTIQRYESGKIAKIKLPVMHAMAKQLDVDPDWLVLKTDEMGSFNWKHEWYNNEEPAHQFDNTPAVESNATMLPDSNVRMIPVYESVSAGFGAHAENMIVDYMPLYIVSAAEAENTLIIRVEGDSMYPKIEDGDSIQVLRQDFAENGQVAVLLIDGEDAVVKQFFHDPDAKTVTLHSLNPDYKDRVFEGIEITKLRVLGVVKRVIKDI
jgi:repressor LexA